MPRNTSVTLGEHFDEFIRRKIAEGRFQSVSEAVRAGLRLLEDDESKLEALRAKLAAAKESPLVEEFDRREFMGQLRDRSAVK